MASETKWTPGPWKPVPNPCDPGLIALTAGEDDAEFGEVWGDDRDSTCWPVTANARLIAAAPDLYEALAWAVKRIPLETARNEGREFQGALDALARAEGKEAVTPC